MRGIPWRLLAAGALTAVLLDLPFPLAGPMPAWRTIFAWFALVPLLVGILRLPEKHAECRLRWQLGWSFLAGWLSGAIWFGLNCYWVYNTMHVYGRMNAPMAALSLVAFSLYLGFWFGVFALALALIRRATLSKKSAWLAFAAVPFLWTSMEFALARIPEFPWDLLGYSQVDSGLLMRLAPWTGVYGISFVVAAVNGLIASGRLLDRSRSQQMFGWSISFGLVWGLAAWGSNWRPPEHPAEATAVLVQPNLNVATDDVWVGPEWDRHIAQFAELAGQKCKGYINGVPESDAAQAKDIDCSAVPQPSLIVWPESPAPFRDRDPNFQSAMAGIVQANKAPLIVGNIGMDADPATQQYHIYNSASVVAMDGHFAGRYDKIHLVPFGEYVPFRRLLFFIHQITENLSDMGNGADRKTFRIGGPNGAHRYGIFICYESVFGDEVRQFVRLGAEVFVNISDDGWYGDSSAPWQHLNMARMRAIENRRWILRDTNNGVTTVIDPWGRVTFSAPRHTLTSLTARYGYGSGLTFYTRHGDLFAWLCSLITLAALVAAMKRPAPTAL